MGQLQYGLWFFFAMVIIVFFFMEIVVNFEKPWTPMTGAMSHKKKQKKNNKKTSTSPEGEEVISGIKQLPGKAQY